MGGEGFYRDKADISCVCNLATLPRDNQEYVLRYLSRRLQTRAFVLPTPADRRRRVGARLQYDENGAGSISGPGVKRRLPGVAVFFLSQILVCLVRACACSGKRAAGEWRPPQQGPEWRLVGTGGEKQQFRSKDTGGTISTGSGFPFDCQTAPEGFGLSGTGRRDRL